MEFRTTYRSPGKFIYVQVMLEQQSWQIRYAVISKKTESSFNWTAATDATDLLKKAGKSLPYVLHFRGFGVLTRIAENISGYRESLLVNGHEEDFYFNSMSFNSTVGVSFLRVSLVSSFIEELRAAKAFIWSVNAGPIPLLALIDRQNSEARFDFSMTIVSGDLRKLERNQESVKSLPGTFYTEDEAYVKAMQLIISNAPEEYTDGLSEEERSAVKSDYKEFVRFIKLGVGMLSLFLFALVGNYFYINVLNSKAAQLETDIAGFGEDLALKDRLEQEKARKTVLVENSGLQSERYLTFYLDEIGASVPSTIQLELLDAFPLKEALKPKRKVDLFMDQISVTGYSSDSKVLDDWMEILEKKTWIPGVELINYVRINDKKAMFNLMVRIKG